MHMFVMTVDQRKSSTSEDLIPQLENNLREYLGVDPPVRGFQRTAGDEAQAVFDRPDVVLATALRLSRLGRWHIGIGAGAVETPLPRSVREGKGQAFVHARAAVERAKKSSAHIAFEGNGAHRGLIEATLQLVMSLEEERSDNWQQVGELYSQGLTQQAIAEQLGTYQSAVSRSLKQGRWVETRRVLDELAGLLAEEK